MIESWPVRKKIQDLVEEEVEVDLDLAAAAVEEEEEGENRGRDVVEPILGVDRQTLTDENNINNATMIITKGTKIRAKRMIT